MGSSSRRFRARAVALAIALGAGIVAGPPAMGEGRRTQPGGGAVAGPGAGVVEVEPLLYSRRLEERARAHHLLAERLRRGVSAGERSALVPLLLEAAQQRQETYELESTPYVAIVLLGALRAGEAIPILLERILDRFPQVGSEATLLTPAGASLVEIGDPAIEPILDRTGVANAEEWRMLSLVLQDMKSPRAVRTAVSRRLAGPLDIPARRRLQALAHRTGGS